ncbi:AbrB/MazE/SpoVT family DNA-binding domain-containing protein [Roseofilum casamattae]|uniref:SpoVT-AbrB domain-containing protein n=1 Tax=Roseofilum casamattae BLCC-M143 TaxID=3022442 RepID=A0ABT7C032_9CYAN|nr:hypothetical protein [Roseofilum casamattae]MDJ1184813.1 hypothetical protein [Roseofilum casamattae BLCC-M143]
MELTVKKQGNSLSVTIPEEIVTRLNLNDGDRHNNCETRATEKMRRRDKFWLFGIVLRSQTSPSI